MGDFKGPGQWRSQAVKAQKTESDSDDAAKGGEKKAEK